MKLLDYVPHPASLLPHGPCLSWNTDRVALQAGSDCIIALCYASIPLAMMWFLHRRRGPGGPAAMTLGRARLTILFASFLLACGTLHGLAALTPWVAVDRIETIVRAIAAVLAVLTAVILWMLIPQALGAPSPASLRKANRELSLKITESDRAADLLRESEALHIGIYNNTPVPLHTLDLQGRLNGISDYWCELLGYSRGDVIERPLLDFCAPEMAGLLADGLAMLLDGGEMRNAECLFRRKDGTLVDVLLSERLERDRMGHPLHILGVLTDVTERRQAERTLRAAEAHLLQTQKLEALGKLTGGIAHDFNNMLTIIDGNLEMLRPRPDVDLGMDAVTRQHIEAASRASRRAGNLTAQLLAFSRRQKLDPKALEPDRVIEGMSGLLSRTVGEQSALQIEICREMPWACLADQNQLEAALLNLVINATHAIADQGRIRIRVENKTLFGAEAAWGDGISDDAVAPGDYVGISVQDDGCGMSEEVRRRALEPFFTTKPTGQGTGLGLSQTYGFVRQSGGALRIDSRPGEGTVVIMLLPRAMRHAIPALVEETPRSHLEPVRMTPLGRASPAETLLVVEDEPEVLEIVGASLRASGFDVICAADATHALAALRGNPLISLIFTDIVMPGINGVALAEEACRLRPGIPVVFASGYSDEAITGQLPKGAMFLQKPYRMASVTRLIHTALAERQLSDA